MTTPLSEKRNSAMNSIAATPSTAHREKTYRADVLSTTPTTSSINDYFEDAQSSPFVSEIAEGNEAEDNVTEKSTTTSPTSDTGVSQLRLLKSRATPSPTKPGADGRSPRKLTSPVRRFPVKVSASSVGSMEAPVESEHNVSLNGVLRDNEGLTTAIQIMDDDDSVLDYGQQHGTADDTILTVGNNAEHEHDNEDFDQTAFSAFSAVPDMTMFAKIGHSPGKFAAVNQTPRPQSYAGPTPASSRRPAYLDQDNSPTPRKSQYTSRDDGNTTNLILDFTEQFSTYSNKGRQSPARNGRLSPTRTVPDLLSYTQNARTPSPAKHRQVSPTDRMSHLLDFDIPPAPTPRSMPSITPRELESLKSGFLSEISSLKASLSGKEAEAQSLKSAVGDAEKRVGESMEQVREERTLREQIAAEKEDWENRAREMEAVLRNVRSDLVQGEKDRESLEGRLQESEMRRDMAETMAQEAESKMAGMRAGSASLSASTGSDAGPKSTSSSREVEIAVEKVARELHTLYKGKHETKVSALKRSYEVKWDRKIKDLETKLEDLTRENDHMRLGHNATMSVAIPNMNDANLQLAEDLREQAAREAQHSKELEARLEGLAEEMRSVKCDNDSLRADLEKERVEKGDLVAACDELLALQESASAPVHPTAPNHVDALRGSVSRASGAPSGLRAPTSGVRAPVSYVNGGMAAAGKVVGSPTGTSRLAKMERHRSAGSVGSQSGLSRPGSGLAMRSGIMSSIEKMGSYKGRDGGY